MNFHSFKISLFSLALIFTFISPVKTFAQEKTEKKAKKEKKVKPDVIIHTDYGDMYVKLFEDTPGHRENFLKLAKEGFYDGTSFHRVIKEFMIQGGDPNTKYDSLAHLAGQGGPGYTLPAEFSKDHVHIKGMLAAARQGDQVNPKRESSGSQFYIVQGKVLAKEQIDMMEKQLKQILGGDFSYSDEQKEAYTTIGGSPWLDMQYTVFGQVYEGLDVIDKIAAVKTKPGDKPAEEIKITMTVKAKVKKKKKK